MTGIAEQYAARTVLLAADDDEHHTPATEPTTRRPHTVWDDLPVIPSGLDEEAPF